MAYQKCICQNFNFSNILNCYRRTQHGKYDHRTGYIAGYGIKFAFGKHSDQSRGTENNPSTYSSCMTSEKGPLDSRFKYCNTKQVPYDS